MGVGEVRSSVARDEGGTVRIAGVSPIRRAAICYGQGQYVGLPFLHGLAYIWVASVCPWRSAGRGSYLMGPLIATLEENLV